MPLNRPPRPTSMTLNLAPMVDVMMCLIIFFLIASKLAGQFPVDLPWAAAAEVVEGADLGDRVTISVRRVAEGDQVAEYVVRDWDGRQVTERVLQPNEVEGLLVVRAAQAARDERPLRCVINADRMVMYRHIEVVLRGCGAAKIRDVVFAAQKGEPPEEGT